MQIILKYFDHHVLSFGSITKNEINYLSLKTSKFGCLKDYFFKYKF